MGLLHGRENAEPPLALEAAVRKWLDQHNAWARHVHHQGPRPVGPPVVVPPAALRFSSVRRSPTRTMVLVGRLAEQRAPLRPPRYACDALDEEHLLMDLPEPVTLEDDLRAELVPTLQGLRGTAVELGRILEALIEGAGAGAPLDDAHVEQHFVEMGRAAAWMAWMGDPRTQWPSWPPEGAALDPDEVLPRRGGELALPF
jgi:hypothetical protein